MGKITSFFEFDRQNPRQASGSLRSVALGIVAVASFAAPAVAKPPPAGVWEQFHFRDAKGRTHTVTEQVQIVRADYAATACGPDLQKGGVSLARFAIMSHPELANMTFVSANCEMDKSGKIKIAVGAWPTGGK